MFPIILLVGVPSAVGTCYVMWGQGQRMILASSRSAASPPPITFLSSCCGIATVVGVYGAQGQAIRFLEGQDPTTTQSQSTRAIESPKSTYKPPKDVADALRRVGRPVLLHVGAASVAFLVAGMVQTKIALWQDPRTAARRLE